VCVCVSVCVCVLCVGVPTDEHCWQLFTPHGTHWNPVGSAQVPSGQATQEREPTLLGEEGRSSAAQRYRNWYMLDINQFQHTTGGLTVDRCLVAGVALSCLSIVGLALQTKPTITGGDLMGPGGG